MRVVAGLSFFLFWGVVVVVVVVVVYNDSSIRSFIFNKVGFSAPPAPPPPRPPPCVGVQIYENMNTQASAKDSYISNQERGRLSNLQQHHTSIHTSNFHSTSITYTQACMHTYALGDGLEDVPRHGLVLGRPLPEHVHACIKRCGGVGSAPQLMKHGLELPKSIGSRTKHSNRPHIQIHTHKPSQSPSINPRHALARLRQASTLPDSPARW